MFQFAGYSDKGCFYNINQDCIMINGQILSQFHDTLSESFYAVVCDGVGGEAYGEVAARLAAEGMANLNADANWPEILKQIEQTNQHILDKQSLFSACAHMATTIAGFVVSEGMGLSFNIGDSRVYVCHDSLVQISEDQTYAQELLRRNPSLKLEELPEAQKHIILNCLGRPQAHQHVNVCLEPLRSGDVVLLSSDGMHDVLSAAEIQAVLKAEGSLYEKCRKLYIMAVDKGSKDNISIIICKVVDN